VHGAGRVREEVPLELGQLRAHLLRCPERVRERERERERERGEAGKPRWGECQAGAFIMTKIIESNNSNDDEMTVTRL
jgi:hypothetical protein